MSTQQLTDRIASAMQKVERRHFMPADKRRWAGVDAASAIGHGQTISQPTTVRRMLTWLEPMPGQRVLDLGSGSGWTSALLAQLVGSEGEVFAVERIAELKHFGEDNWRNFSRDRQGYASVQFFLAQQQLGLVEHAPFDRILVSAAAEQGIPKQLVKQLAGEGKLVMPVRHSIFELRLDNDGELDYCREHTGYAFVPLIF